MSDKTGQTRKEAGTVEKASRQVLRRGAEPNLLKRSRKEKKNKKMEKTGYDAGRRREEGKAGEETGE